MHDLSGRWVRYGSDLVHVDSGLTLHGPRATVGWAHPDLVRMLRDDLAGTRPWAAQLNREDLLTWLVDRGALAGQIPGIVQGPGWQQLTDIHGATRWVRNSPGVPALTLPPGLTTRPASGAGMLCLVDSLSQLLGEVVPAHQRGEVSTSNLTSWLQQNLPRTTATQAAEARRVGRGQMLDVWTVLPVLTTMWGVRVQVFRHAENSLDYEWPGYQTIQPAHLEGPARDGAGNPTPILRLYWRGNHFEPIFPVEIPAQASPAAAPSTTAPALAGVGPPEITQAWQARDALAGPGPYSRAPGRARDPRRRDSPPGRQ